MLVAVAGAGLIGCCPKPPPPEPQPVLYEGPLASEQEVVGRLSAANAQVRTIWTRQDFAVSIRDRKDRVHTADGDGTLLLRKPEAGSGLPTELRLKGNKDVLGEVFDLGANRERAWLILRHDIDTMYWMNQGSTVEIDPATLPARPDLVAEVLGLGDVSTDLAVPPAPVMRFDSDKDCYVLTFVEPAKSGPDRMVTRREIWVGRSDYRPRQVVLYAPDGRVAVRSELKQWAPLAGSAGSGGGVGGGLGGGFVPTDITLFFPLSRSTMRFTLREPAASRNGFPKDASFVFPRDPGVSNVEQLDAAGGMKRQ